MELIDHPELWPRLGHAAREIVQEKYDLRRQVQELQVLYREVLYRGTAASRCRNTDSK
jgi:glycosyltransferase involved in cell wall biosynthesis